MSNWLECNHCGIPVLEPDDEGCFWEGNTAICIECGCESVVDVDDSDDPPRASSNTSDDAINFGQGQCDGTCGACRRYVDEGHPCRLDCSRVSDDVRVRVRALIEAGKSEDEITEAMEL